MSNKWIVFRADASIDIGSGHIMRCLTLAKGFLAQNFKVIFFCRSVTYSLTQYMLGQGVSKVVVLSNNSSLGLTGTYTHSNWLNVSELEDASEVSQNIEVLSREFSSLPSCIVVDHYALAAPWEHDLSRFSPIFVIDDLNDRPHTSKWLLDQTLGKNEHSYAGLAPEQTVFFIGTKYALLRKEFSEKRSGIAPSTFSVGDKKHLLVTLGGVDKDNVTSKVVDAIELLSIQDIAVTLIAGPANPNFDALKLKVDKSSTKIDLYRSVDDMAGKMLEADLCIGAAGSTSWERCALGLPTVNIVLAKNQETIAKNLELHGAAINFGYLTDFRVKELNKTIENLLLAPDEIYRMKQAAFKVCDGLGVDRVIEKVLEEI